MTTATKTEKPILFSTEMIQAILDGRKTQTRRVIKPQPADTKAECKPVRKVADYFTGVPENGQVYYWRENGCWNSSEPFKCPYRADELWVRETFALMKPHDHLPPSDYPEDLDIWYKADKEHDEPTSVMGKWRPSIHMPRWASRIQLTVEDIRVERVQDISEEDAIAEGIKVDSSNHAIRPEDDINWGGAKGRFAELWDEINANRGYSWESNPWVWVVEFSIKDIKG